MGVTEERYDFLEKSILKDGMSRKAAINALLKSKCGKKRDGKPISRSTAETMAYQRFSGERFAVKPKKKAKAKATPTKKAPVKKKVITKVKPKAPVKKAVIKKPVAKRPVVKKPVAKKAAKQVAKKATKPPVKKTPIKEKSFKEKAIDEVRQSTKTSAKKKVDKGDTLETRTTVKSKKRAPKTTSTPVSRKKKVVEGSELVF